MPKTISCENCGNPIEGTVHLWAPEDLWACDDCNEAAKEERQDALCMALRNLECSDWWKSWARVVNDSVGRGMALEGWARGVTYNKICEEFRKVSP